jgi:heme-degrading monooxygenase HmoA
MVEVSMTYDFVPGVDEQAFAEFATKVVSALRQAPGFVELRGNRNMLGSPQAKGTSVWQTMADWARFSESDEYRALDAAFRGFVTNLKVDIWGPSPVLPEPIRP